MYFLSRNIFSNINYIFDISNLIIWNLNLKDRISFEDDFYTGKTWHGVKFCYKNVFHFLINKKTYL